MEDELARLRRAAAHRSRSRGGRAGWGGPHGAIPTVVDCPLTVDGCRWSGPAADVRFHLGETHGRRYDQG